MKLFTLILFFALLVTTKAQQSNHLVVQSYHDVLDIKEKTYSEAANKLVLYDLNFNYPDIKVDKIESNRIINDKKLYNIGLYESPGYLSISNLQGNLIAYLHNNILYNSSGDSIDFLSQYGGFYGVVCKSNSNDTYTLYYIQSKTEFNANSFHLQNFNQSGPPFYLKHDDSFFLVKAVYKNNIRIEKSKIPGIEFYGKSSLLQSNLTIFKSRLNQIKIQFVWNYNLYEINTDNNHQIKYKKIFNSTRYSECEYHDWLGVIGFEIISGLVTSPSGRWSVFNHADLYCSNNSYIMSKNSLFVIDNEADLKIIKSLSDSGYLGNQVIKCWQKAVFTKEDSTFLVQQTTADVQILNKPTKMNEIILEIQIRDSSLITKDYKILIDSHFAVVNHYPKQQMGLKDFHLGPNGNIYVFLISQEIKKSKMGENTPYNQYHIAKLKKGNTFFYFKDPTLIFEGVNHISTDDVYTRHSINKLIYFPATPTPYHYINFTNKSICNDLTHAFTNETDTNWFDHFMWFWGDGDSTASHKSQPIVRHQYPKPGKYRVNLKSITAHGGWVWYSDSVEVLPEPIAKYQTKNTVGCQWIAVRFNDSSVLQKKNHTWYWDFGDGNDTILQSSNGVMPTQKRIEHTYSTSGKFNVQLRITDGRCTDTFSTTQNIDILPAPRPGISIDKTSGCTPLEVRFGRTFTDLTDSTIYHFKPALNPNNRFNGSQNTAVISKSGPYILHQKLYGPSGCVTEDSVSLQITQGILPGTKPQLKRSTVVNNRTVLTDWNPVPHAKDYQVYRNGQPHAVATDTQFIDRLNRDIDRTYIYEIIAKDSCGNLASAKSNIGKPIFLQVKQIEPASKSEFATALLTWTPYEDWSNSGGVENYSIFGNYAIESQSWQLLKNQTDTQLHDPDFIAPPNYEKCYRINAKSLDGRFQTQSNVACLDFPATLFAPNSFTPNSDGLNDAFEIFNYGFDQFTMTIYNSWGQKVFDQTGPTPTWHPSKDIPQGVYIYQIKAVRNEKEFNFSGTVSLLR